MFYFLPVASSMILPISSRASFNSAPDSFGYHAIVNVSLSSLPPLDELLSPPSSFEALFEPHAAKNKLAVSASAKIIFSFHAFLSPPSL